jgi:3,4-dihydroxy 2-butanone 4-phosphate synthase/GTP cyclohydrolase II
MTPSRENEGRPHHGREFVDAPAINFMARNARGLICVPMEGERLQELGLG